MNYQSQQNAVHRDKREIGLHSVATESVGEGHSYSMLVDLEGSHKRENYCFQHEVQFESAGAYEFHVKWCESFLEVKNLCTVSDSNGLMCAQEFKHITSLVAHIMKNHRMYLCVFCKRKFNSVREIEEHTHSSNGYIHEGRGK